MKWNKWNVLLWPIFKVEKSHPLMSLIFFRFIHFDTHSYIYIYIYIYIVRQTVPFYQNSSVCLVSLDSRSWDQNLADWRQSKVLPLSHEGNQRKQRKFKRLCITFVLFTYIRLTATGSSIHLKSLALHFLRWRAQPYWGRGALLYCPPQTDFLYYQNSSVFARQAWLPKLRSNFISASNVPMLKNLMIK